MQNLYDFMVSNYSDDRTFQAFKEKFPKMFEFSKEVKIVPWKEEYAVGDCNPEIVDALKELHESLEKRLISPKEYLERFEELRKEFVKEGASKTEGMAFPERKEVSFRDKKPSFYVVLHELGHVYFKVDDSLWKARFGGGELVFWLILRGEIDAEERNEELVRAYINLFYKLQKEKKVKEVSDFLNEVARRVAKEYNLFVRNAKELALSVGTLLSCVTGDDILKPESSSGELDRRSCFEFIIAMMDGTVLGETLWEITLKEFVNKLLEEV